MADDILLTVLREYQKSLQMNDIEFADWLRIPTVTWRRTKAGYITLGRRVLKAAVDREIITRTAAGHRLLEDDKDGNGMPAPGGLSLRKVHAKTAEGATK